MDSGLQAIITVMSIAAMGVSSNGHNKVPQSDEERLAIVTQTPEVAEQLKVGSQWFLVGWYTCMFISDVSLFVAFPGRG